MSPRGRLTVAGLVVAGLSGAFIAGSRAPDNTLNTTTGQAVIQQFSADGRASVDDFTGELLDGSQFDSRGVGAGPAVYNVWGSWCAPCRTEAPALRQAAQAYVGRVGFIGLNVRDDASSARAFERRFGIPYPSISSADSGKAMLAFGTSLGVAAVPATVVTDRQGRIAARVVGPTTLATLRTLIDEVLAEPG